MTEVEQEKQDNTSTAPLPVGLDSDEKETLRNGGAINFRLLFTAFIVLGSTFQFGYNLGVMNTTREFISPWIGRSHKHLFGVELTEQQITLIFSAAVACFPTGGIIGGLLIGYVADRVGRKRALHFNNILSLLAGTLTTVAYFTNCYPIFHLGRLVIGVNAGLSSGIVPMYLTELSPVRYRGAFGSLSQFVIGFTIFFSQVLGLPFILGTEKLWIWTFALLMIPSAIQIVGLFFVPESPKYTVMFRNDYKQARKDLMTFRKDPKIVDLELRELEHEKSKLESIERLSIKQLFASSSLRWPLTLVIVLMTFHQLSGINAVNFYSTKIFEQAGLTGSTVIYAAIGVSILNFLASLLSVWLVDHRLFGRRSLLYINMFGMTLTSIGLVVSLAFTTRHIIEEVAGYLSIVFCASFVFFYASGPVTVPFFYTSEIFLSEARGSANSVAIAVRWFFNVVVSLIFLPLTDVMHEFAFLVFSAICLVSAIFVIVFVPETKHKLVDEIQHDLKHRKIQICR